MTRPRRNSAMAPALATLVVAAALLAAAPAAAQDVPFEKVIAGLNSPDPTARIGALVLLRQAGYLEAAPAIAPLLADPDPTVQGAAVETVLTLYLVDVNYTVAFGRSIVKQKGATLPLYAFVQGPGATIANAAPPEVIRGLVQATGAPAPTVRFDAAYTLAVLARPLLAKGQFQGATAVADCLVAILRESNPVMKEAATNALGRLFGAANLGGGASGDLASLRIEAGDLIVGSLNEPDLELRLASMAALGEMRYERAVQSLTDLFNYHKKGPEAMAAFDAVAAIGHPGSLPVFLAQLGHRDANVRRLAIEGIARTGDTEAMAQVKARMDGDQSAVRRPRAGVREGAHRRLQRDDEARARLQSTPRWSRRRSPTWSNWARPRPANWRRIRRTGTRRCAPAWPRCSGSSATRRRSAWSRC